MAKTQRVDGRTRNMAIQALRRDVSYSGPYNEQAKAQSALYSLEKLHLPLLREEWLFWAARQCAWQAASKQPDVMVPPSTLRVRH